MTLDELVEARNQADLRYLDAHAETIVYLDDGEELYEEPVDALVNKDGLMTSDRCPRCTALVACQRCKELVETAQDDGIDAVDLVEERRLIA